MKLEKMGEGRYDVRGTLVGADMRLFPNTRLGLVMGGGNKWAAESASGDALGTYRTRRDAAAAVEQDAIEPNWIAMQRYAASVGLPRSYQSDLLVDRQILREWRQVPGMRFLWVLRENGTNFIPLDLEWSRREAKAVLEAFKEEFVRKDSPARATIVDTTYGRVREVPYEKAVRLLDEDPKYHLNNARRVILDAQDQVIGGIQMNGTWEHAATITVLAKGIDRRLEPLLRSGAAAYFSHYFGTLFGPKVSNVSVQF